MAGRAVIVAIGLAVSACAAPARHPGTAVPTAALLSADGLPVSESVEVVPEQAIFALDDHMRAFVAERTRRRDLSRHRVNDLLRGMREIGLFDLDYRIDGTLTARETFHQRRGNCLSFTILFAALAREAGLNVRFQLVAIPPSWTGDSERVILTNHINALVRSPSEPDYVVDFNVTEYKGNYAVQTVSDGYAVALFYSNRGVEAMLAQRDAESAAYLRHALEAYPDIAGVWVNLGVLYAQHGLAEHAEAAYLEALQADTRDRSALVNLAKLYRDEGRSALADEYYARVRRYQQRNPYYHYALARNALEARRPREALKLLDKALRRKKDEHQFYFLQSLAFSQLDDSAAARKSLGRARAYAQHNELREEYAARIAALDGDR